MSAIRSHVLTVTPNPALDMGGVVERIKPNEKTYVHDETRSPGGNAINVARILTRLRVPVQATGFLGGGVGKEIGFLLDQENVKNEFIEIKGHSRISVTVSNRSDHQQTRLSFSGPTIQRSERQRLFHLFAHRRHISLLVIGGSLPGGFESRDVRKLMKQARRRNIGVVVDTPGRVLRDLLDERTLLTKPNLDEFQELTGTRVKTIGSVIAEARKWLDRVSFFCISSVEGGTLLVTSENSYFGRIPKVTIRSSVGAGDSMVGAMVARLHHGVSSGEDLLRWGLAASAANLSHHGTAMGSSHDIQTLFKRTVVEVVS